MDKYRGIAVGSLMGKVLSLVLHSCPSQWREQRGISAVGQAGFGAPGGQVPGPRELSSRKALHLFC